MKPLRIAVTGPESSGKTTLAEALATELHGYFAPEFARDYLLALDRPYTQQDLDIIAQKQVDLWPSDKQLLICDTEMLVMTVWSEVSYAVASPLIQQLWGQQQFDHYFLCTPDIPWEEDPLREHPDQRDWLFDKYLTKITAFDLPHTILSGSHENRMHRALSIIRDLQIS